jgi:hypothetical protein
MPKILPAPYADYHIMADASGDRFGVLSSCSTSASEEHQTPQRADLTQYLDLGNPSMTKSILNKRMAQIAVAAVIGAIAGLAVFTVAQVTGRNLYIVIGGVAGAAAILVLQQYWRTAQLTEVKITVPQVSELTFVVNNDARQVAWKLYIETVTRISTQPLSDEEGFIREALTSLYGLFATTRDTLKAGRPSVPVSGGQTVEHLAVTMLNHELRPFLSKWHPRLREFEETHPNGQESAWPDNVTCRSELRHVQANLVGFALGFARLAGVRNAEAAIIQPTDR